MVDPSYFHSFYKMKLECWKCFLEILRNFCSFQLWGNISGTFWGTENVKITVFGITSYNRILYLNTASYSKLLQEWYKSLNSSWKPSWKIQLQYACTVFCWPPILAKDCENHSNSTIQWIRNRDVLFTEAKEKDKTNGGMQWPLKASRPFCCYDSTG